MRANFTQASWLKKSNSKPPGHIKEILNKTEGKKTSRENKQQQNT